MILEQTAKVNYNHSYSVPVLVAVTFAKEEERRHPFSNKYDKRHGPACKVKTCITKKVERKSAQIIINGVAGRAGAALVQRCMIRQVGLPFSFPFPPDLGSTNIHPSTRKSFFCYPKKPLIKRAQSPPRYCACMIPYRQSKDDTQPHTQPIQSTRTARHRHATRTFAALNIEAQTLTKWHDILPLRKSFPITQNHPK